LLWGESDLRQKRYGEAESMLLQAQEDDTGDQALSRRVLRDLYLTYRGWLDGDTSGFPYRRVLESMSDYKSSADCDTACQPAVRLLMARTILGEGQALIRANACSEAASDYQTLVDGYKDTPYAQQAGAALVAPVDVTATIDGLPAAILASTQSAY